MFDTILILTLFGLTLVLAGLFWFFAIVCLKGCDWLLVILISGFSLADKETKQKYREKNDIPAMNKYMGKTMFLPWCNTNDLFFDVFA
ncbi:MAG: hypothetical protein FWG63_08745 [Defluviitaleaceae bacterium]|nr:hypothetical protein [Defluviitaleaceae bacterium]